jgi:hypothetical protein
MMLRSCCSMVYGTATRDIIGNVYSCTYIVPVVERSAVCMVHASMLYHSVNRHAAALCSGQDRV